MNRLMGTSVVVLLKISFSIIRCRQIHCYLKAKFPRQLIKLFPMSLFPSGQRFPQAV